MHNKKYNFNHFQHFFITKNSYFTLKELIFAELNIRGINIREFFGLKFFKVAFREN